MRLHWFIFLLSLCFLQSCETKPKTSYVSSINNASIEFVDGRSEALNTNKNDVTILLLRHAEKEQSQKANPGLSDQGEKRAIRLNEMLSELKIDSVHSTKYNRTMLTIKPIIENKPVVFQAYDPSNLGIIASKLAKAKKGSVHLVVGHSNTTPELVNLLMENEKLEWIEEKEYDHLYVVQINGNKKKLLELKFKGE